MGSMKRVLAERYELGDRIGRGAMGEIWGARDLQTGLDVAVKLARGWALASSELVDRFEREGRILKRLASSHICSLIDQGRADDGTPYLVLERLTGETLETLLEREVTLSLAETVSFGSSVLEGLVVAHNAGIVHRDLSSTNIYMHRAPDGRVIVKLLDFGVAKTFDVTSPATGHRVTMGSLAFVAPEQLGEAANAGPRADLYAVGTIVFRALAGRMPFGDLTDTALLAVKREHDSPSIDEVTGEKWPVAIRSFLAKTTARLPSKRYDSAEVALASLRLATRGKTPKIEAPAKPPPTMDPTLTVGPRKKR